MPNLSFTFSYSTECVITKISQDTFDFRNSKTWFSPSVCLHNGTKRKTNNIVTILNNLVVGHGVPPEK